MKIASRSSSFSLQKLSPHQVLLLYYAAGILLGAVLLMLPVASRTTPLPFLDALFTATSAQCVTGLVVVDTGSQFTLFGQLVILTLIQIGGLGITTFSVYLFYYLRLGVGHSGRMLIHETLLHSPIDSVRELIRDILILTLAIEGLGAFALAWSFIPEFGWLKGSYYALFHAVSAFCNAGFALFPDSLCAYRSSPLVNITLISLITLGGIGFLVIRELLARLKPPNGPRRRLTLHTRLVLWTSLALTCGGAIALYLLERPASFSSFGVAEQIWSALFQSVSARTAGFNSVDLSMLEIPSLFLIMFLMFIGASPGSSGGGIKTTSLALFIAILHSRLKGNPHTNIFRRTIPAEAETKVLSLVMLAMLILGVSIFSLLTIQLSGLSFSDSRGAFMDFVFEAVSAFGTVGLTVGGSAKLLPAGKLLIILLMFIGRVGLLTVAFAILQRRREHALRYAEENIMIG
ncbi:MAG: potassium transporter [Desulfuromonas sp.]|nr:MAG: potassium transporter [Desulfuromonas sp.]